MTLPPSLRRPLRGMRERVRNQVVDRSLILQVNQWGCGRKAEGRLKKEEGKRRAQIGAVSGRTRPKIVILIAQPPHLIRPHIIASSIRSLSSPAHYSFNCLATLSACCVDLTLIWFPLDLCCYLRCVSSSLWRFSASYAMKPLPLVAPSVPTILAFIVTRNQRLLFTNSSGTLFSMVTYILPAYNLHSYPNSFSDSYTKRRARQYPPRSCATTSRRPHSELGNLRRSPNVRNWRGHVREDEGLCRGYESSISCMGCEEHSR